MVPVTDTRPLIGVLRCEDVKSPTDVSFSHKPDVLWDEQPRPGREDSSSLFLSGGLEAEWTREEA